MAQRTEHDRTGHFEPPAGTDEDAPRFEREAPDERPVVADADTPGTGPDARGTAAGQLAAEQAEVSSDENSRKALWALICGGVGVALSFIPLFGWVLGGVAIGLGAAGRADARRGMRGRSRATIGLVLGLIAIGISTAVFVANVATVT